MDKTILIPPSLTLSGKTTLSTCNDYPLCRGVGILLICICILGNELHENRNGHLPTGRRNSLSLVKTRNNLHDQAFGCSILEASIPLLHEKANEDLKNIDFGEGIHYVDFIINENVDVISAINDIEKYNSIWGSDNNKPLFAINVTGISPKVFNIIGAKKDTIRFSHEGITYIKFRAIDLVEQIEALSPESTIEVSIVGRSNLNEWNGVISPQIIIEDIEIKEYDRFAF